MAEVDFTKYSTVDQIENDIKTIRIQGATNVAIATFEGIKLYLRNLDASKVTHTELMKDAQVLADRLANARLNEPLAKNGVKYIFNLMKLNHPGLSDVNETIEVIGRLADEYLNLIKVSKEKIVEVSEEVLSSNVKTLLTHCHSSTAEKAIVNHANRVEDVKVICSETRPLYQGRLTAAALRKHQVDTTIVADSSIESFIIGRANINPQVIMIGCDEVTVQGDAINKVGSWGVALAAYYASKPIYVLGSILKTDLSTAYRPVEIEMRDATEVLWEGAPAGLKAVNPSFDLIDHQYITGFITELGVLKPSEIHQAITENYQWLF